MIKLLRRLIAIHHIPITYNWEALDLIGPGALMTFRLYSEISSEQEYTFTFTKENIAKLKRTRPQAIMMYEINGCRILILSHRPQVEDLDMLRLEEVL